MCEFVCTKCGIAKPRTSEHWHVDRAGPNGFRTQCKLCRNSDLRLKKPNECSRYGELVRCSECQIEKPRTAEFWPLNKGASDGFRVRCRGCVNAANKCRRQADPQFREGRRIAVAKWRGANLDLVRQRARESAFANADRHRANAKRWVQENPDKARSVIRASKAGRRARLAAAEGNHSAADLRAINDLQGGQCYWCNAIIVSGNFSADHYVPLSKGGTNWPDNIVIACKACNSSKRDKLPDEFRSYIARRQKP